VDLVLNPGGNVGIGNTDPGQLLQLGGTANGIMRFEASDGDEVDLGITTSDEFYITGGSVGIGTTDPGQLFDVVGGSIRTDADMYSGDIYLGYDDTSATITTVDVNEDLTLDPNGTGRVNFHGSSYYMDSGGEFTFQKFVEFTDSQWFLDPGSGTTSLDIAGGIDMDGVITMNNATSSITTGGSFTIDTNDSSDQPIYLDAGTAKVCVGSSGSCTGKIDAGTVDPPYTINGRHYATYMASMTGVKEETAGTVTTGEYIPGVGYKRVIDFRTQEEGSDLWLFAKTTDLRQTIDQMVVLLSPSSNTRAWYTLDEDDLSLAIYTSKPTRVSYRLTAPRFDHEKWVNDPEDGSIGFILDDPDMDPSDVLPADFSYEESLSQINNLTLERIEDQGNISYNLKDQAGNILTDVSSFSSLVVGNLRSGMINTQELVVEQSARVGELMVTGSLSVADTFSAGLVTTQEVSTDVLSVASDNVSVAGQSLREYIVQVVQDAPELTDLTGSVASPLVETEKVRTGVLSPVADENLTIDLNNTPEESEEDTYGDFTVKGTDGQDIFTLSPDGDASVAGEFTSSVLNVDGDTDIDGSATISGTLYADRIVTRHGEFTELETETSSYDDEISALEGSVASLRDELDTLKQPSPTPEPTSTPLPTPTPVEDPVYEPDATSSALLTLLENSVNNLEERVDILELEDTSPDILDALSDNIILANDLSVFGTTNLGETYVMGDLYLGEHIHIADGSINATVGNTLFFQKNKLADVDILDGTMRINTMGEVVITGDVFVSGDLEVGGVLSAQKITGDGNDIEIDLSDTLLNSSTQSATSTYGDLIVRGEDGESVFEVSASGSAKFANDVDIDGSLSVGEQSLGVDVLVGSGDTSIVVDGLILDTSEYVVQVVPNWNTSVWVTGKSQNQFVINFSTST